MTLHRWRAPLAAALAAILVSSAAVAGPAAAAPTVAPPAVAAAEQALVRVELPNEAMFDELVASGADIATRPRADGNRVRVDVVLTGAQLAALTARGARLVQVVQRAGDGTARHQASVRAARGVNAADTLHFL